MDNGPLDESHRGGEGRVRGTSFEDERLGNVRPLIWPVGHLLPPEWGEEKEFRPEFTLAFTNGR